MLRGVVPPTASGVFAILCGVTLLLPAGAPAFPYLGLAFMGLPTMMILDLFLGLPLRSVATATAVALLEFAGLPVVQTGLEIAVGGTSVWVDVPCAGVHMLGAGALTAFVLAALFRLNWWRTALLASAALFAVVVANVARIVALTAFVLRGTELSPGAHSAVGCVLLVPAIVAIALLAHLMSWRSK
jgi:exosortase